MQTKQPGENPPQTDCAEAQWEVTTTPEHSADLLGGLQETACRVTLQKAPEALLLKLGNTCLMGRFSSGRVILYFVLTKGFLGFPISS